MNDPEKRIDDEQLDAYLDGRLDEAARKAFEQHLREDEDLASRVEIQTSVDQSLQRQFSDTEPSEVNMRAIAAALASRSESLGPPSTIHIVYHGALRTVISAAAAAIVGIAAMLLFNGDDTETPFFEPRPLVRLYQESIANGFAPYYECRDDERFADTFLRRQSQPLRLLPMPDGSEMLGISYPGGLSRDTTAVLCRVDGTAVMVFVDRAESDDLHAADNDDPRLNVFRHEKYGLVFYEVTPLDAAHMIDRFAVSDAE
jgi:hypothetical protein